MIFLMYANILCLLAFILISIYVNIKQGDNISDILVIYTALTLIGLLFTSALALIIII